MTSHQNMHGCPVISIETGQRLGSIDQIVFEPDGSKVAAFTVQSDAVGGIISPEQPTASWLLVGDVHAIGPDAVTVANPASLRETIERKDYLLAGDLVRRKVVTEGGSLIGTVAAIHFDPQSRAVTEVEISRGFFKSNPQIGFEHVVTVGHDVIVVDDAANPGEETTRKPADQQNQTVVGDVTTGDQPGTYQVVRNTLDGQQTTAKTKD
jgi:uncharacterized protein YrrD